MEKNTQNYKEIRLKFEDILHSLGYSFEELNIDDEDINYSIDIVPTGNLKKLNSIDALMYLTPNTYYIYLLIGNIYKFQKSEDIDPFYKLINTVNESISGGTFTINEITRQILYSSSIYCGQNFKEMSKNKVVLLLEPTINNLLIMLDAIKMEKTKNGK